MAAIVPAYNYGRYLAEALESVLAQTVRVREVVVVDDGSTDDTPEVVRPFVESGRVRYTRQQNAGVSAARNHGIRATTARYVAFLDADDAWMPRKIERQMREFQREPGLGMVTCAAWAGEGTEVRLLPAEVPSGDALAELLGRGNILGASASSAMVRRECLERVGQFDPGLSVSADWDLWIRLAQAFPVRSLSEPLTRYRLVPGRRSMGSNVAVLERDTLAILARAFQDGGLPPLLARNRDAVYCHHLAVIAKSYLRQGQLRQAARVLRSAMARSPRFALRSSLLSKRDTRQLHRRYLGGGVPGR